MQASCSYHPPQFSRHCLIIHVSVLWVLRARLSRAASFTTPTISSCEVPLGVFNAIGPGGTTQRSDQVPTYHPF